MDVVGLVVGGESGPLRCTGATISVVTRAGPQVVHLDRCLTSDEHLELSSALSPIIVISGEEDSTKRHVFGTTLASAVDELRSINNAESAEVSIDCVLIGAGDEEFLVDALDKEATCSDLRIRDDWTGGVTYLHGAKSVQVKDGEEAKRVVDSGTPSARCHKIVAVHVGTRRVATLILIAPAAAAPVGSGAPSIPQWVRALAGVLSAIESRAPRIPFSASPLTQLLRPALTGSCRATFVAVAPNIEGLGPSTILFAGRIRNAAHSLSSALRAASAPSSPFPTNGKVAAVAAVTPPAAQRSGSTAVHVPASPRQLNSSTVLSHRGDAHAGNRHTAAEAHSMAESNGVVGGSRRMSFSRPGRSAPQAPLSLATEGLPSSVTENAEIGRLNITGISDGGDGGKGSTSTAPGLQKAATTTTLGAGGSRSFNAMLAALSTSLDNSGIAGISKQTGIITGPLHGTVNDSDVAATAPSERLAPVSPARPLRVSAVVELKSDLDRPAVLPGAHRHPAEPSSVTLTGRADEITALHALIAQLRADNAKSLSRAEAAELEAATIRDDTAAIRKADSALRQQLREHEMYRAVVEDTLRKLQAETARLTADRDAAVKKEKAAAGVVVKERAALAQAKRRTGELEDAVRELSLQLAQQAARTVTAASTAPSAPGQRAALTSVGPAVLGRQAPVGPAGSRASSQAASARMEAVARRAEADTLELQAARQRLERQTAAMMSHAPLQLPAPPTPSAMSNGAGRAPAHDGPAADPFEAAAARQASAGAGYRSRSMPRSSPAGPGAGPSPARRLGTAPTISTYEGANTLPSPATASRFGTFRGPSPAAAPRPPAAVTFLTRTVTAAGRGISTTTRVIPRAPGQQLQPQPVISSYAAAHRSSSPAPARPGASAPQARPSGGMLDRWAEALGNGRSSDELGEETRALLDDLLAGGRA